MDYEIAVSPGNEFIRIRVLVDVTADIVARFSRDARALSEKTNIYRILSDERAGRSLTNITQTYEFAHKQASDHGPTHRWRIAVLKDPDTPEYDCVETVMRNAGYVFRIFTQEDEAISWLTDAAGEQSPAGDV